MKMDIRKIIREELSKILFENYPWGAEYHPDAPWNQKETPKGQRAKNIVYKLLWTDEREFAFFKCPEGVCVMYLDSLDKDELAPYADREETFLGYDEDGMPDVEYGDWEITGDVIENYVNDNLGSLTKGKGLDDYESGEYDLVILDDALRADLMGISKYIKDDSRRDSFINILSGQISESSKKKDKTLISESMNVHIKDFPYQEEFDNILDISHYVIKKVAYDLLPNNMAKEDIRSLSIGDRFMPDGGYAFEPTGVMNFYIKGYPEELVDKTISFVKYVLSEQNIKVGEISREGDRVIRIHIDENNHENKNHPDINLSNSNAEDIFENVLGYEDVGEEMDAVELIMKIKSARNSLFNKPEKSSFIQQGNSFIPSHGKDYYNNVLDRLENIAQWAIDNGYRTLYVA